jgi:hypothetical protein
MAANPATTKTWSTTGTSEEFGPIPGRFCFDLSGTFVATIVIERKRPGGDVWIPLTAGGVPLRFTGTASEVLDEPLEGARYRMNCTSYTNGTPIGSLQQ